MTDLWLELAPEPDTTPAEYNALLRELKQLLTRELGVSVAIRAANRTAPGPREDRARGDSIALVTMLLAIPSAALALHDLAARARLKDCLHRVLARARQCGSRASWRYAVDHIALPGDEPREAFDPDDLVDELVRARHD